MDEAITFLEVIILRRDDLDEDEDEDEDAKNPPPP
jgi:hypothetical protein